MNVTETGTVNCISRMETKSTMGIHKNEKEEIRRENACDNIKGGASLFQGEEWLPRDKNIPVQMFE